MGSSLTLQPDETSPLRMCETCLKQKDGVDYRLEVGLYLCEECDERRIAQQRIYHDPLGTIGLD